MSQPCWRNLLRQALNRLEREKGPDLRVAAVGIGQPLRGDDAAGLAAARRLKQALGEYEERLLVLEAGSVPENCSGLLRRHAPDLILFLDAVTPDVGPGRIRWLTLDSVTGFGASTHTLPLSTLAHYLQAEIGCKVFLLGFQPADTQIGAPLTPALSAAVDEVVSELVEVLAKLHFVRLAYLADQRTRHGNSNRDSHLRRAAHGTTNGPGDWQVLRRQGSEIGPGKEPH